MRVHQYVYFALDSNRAPAAEITTRLGIEPDEVTIRGSRQTQPPIPVSHTWRIACRKPGLSVSEQIDQILDRLYVHADRIGELVAELDRIEGSQGSSILQVVRVFEYSNDEDEDLTSTTDGPQRLTSQHQLLGWHLDARTLDFLQRTRAELDIDEYAYG
jgi:hypothetical protein